MTINEILTQTENDLQRLKECSISDSNRKIMAKAVKADAISKIYVILRDLENEEKDIVYDKFVGKVSGMTINKVVVADTTIKLKTRGKNGKMAEYSKKILDHLVSMGCVWNDELQRPDKILSQTSIARGLQLDEKYTSVCLTGLKRQEKVNNIFGKGWYAIN